jgi:hypothetical protein
MNMLAATAPLPPADDPAGPVPPGTATGTARVLCSAPGGLQAIATLHLTAPADVRLLRAVRPAGSGAALPRLLEVLVAADGRRALCRWQGADANAVLAALMALGIHGETWDAVVLDLFTGCSSRERGEHLQANVVVEDRRVNGDGLRSIFPYDRLASCLIRRRVTPVRVALSLDGLHLLAFYRAPDAEAVRLAQRRGSVCAGMVWACDMITGYGPGDPAAGPPTPA